MELFSFFLNLDPEHLFCDVDHDITGVDLVVQLLDDLLELFGIIRKVLKWLVFFHSRCGMMDDGVMNNNQMPQVLRYLMSSSTSSKDLSSDFDGITLVRT